MVQRAAPLLALGRYARQMLSHRPRLFAATLALNVANGMLEGVSLFLLVPLLGFLGVGEAPDCNPWPCRMSSKRCLGPSSQRLASRSCWGCSCC